MANFGGQVVLNWGEIEQMLHGEAGPVMRHMIVVGERVKQAAIGQLKPGFPRDFLGPRIVKRVVNKGGGPGISVGAEKVTTRPHVIAKYPGMLAFYWPKKGAMVFTHAVHHPGSDFAHPTEHHPEGYIQEVLRKAVETASGTLF